jgi:hypothetical protein
VHAIGRGQYRRPRRHALLGHTVMYVGGRQQAEAAVMMFGVVPREEDVAMGADVLDRAEPFRVGGAWASWSVCSFAAPSFSIASSMID